MKYILLFSFSILVFPKDYISLDIYNKSEILTENIKHFIENNGGQNNNNFKSLYLKNELQLTVPINIYYNIDTIKYFYDSNKDKIILSSRINIGKYTNHYFESEYDYIENVKKYFKYEWLIPSSVFNNNEYYRDYICSILSTKLLKLSLYNIKVNENNEMINFSANMKYIYNEYQNRILNPTRFIVAMSYETTTKENIIKYDHFINAIEGPLLKYGFNLTNATYSNEFSISIKLYPGKYATILDGTRLKSYRCASDYVIKYNGKKIIAGDTANSGLDFSDILAQRNSEIKVGQIISEKIIQDLISYVYNK